MLLYVRQITSFPLKRLMSTSKTILEHLNTRTLIRVSGHEVSDFLQGLITNDMKHLSGGPGSMYTMFLNTKGRIMYDAIVYRPAENDTYFVECDNEASSSLQKHLKMYRVRRKIDIASLDDEYKIYALFKVTDAKLDCSGIEMETGGQSESLPHSYMKTHKDLLVYKDPRTLLLGSRILSKSADIETQVSDISTLSSGCDRNYRWLRYYLGIGEGIRDLPPAESFPLECNCDYLHGVSFHKGCYIGQELTARVHHTGVVRKRLMPIHFIKTPAKLPEESIIHENQNLGKFRGLEGDVGLGLLRIAKVLAFKEINIGSGIAVVSKPKWWPVEAPKESMTKAAM